MNKEIAKGLIAAGGLALSSCTLVDRSTPTPIKAPELPPVTFTPTLTSEFIPTETSFPESDGYFSEGLFCPAEPTPFDLPEVGEVVEFQNMTWKIIAVSENDGETCEGGLRVMIEFCPCVEEETPTPTATKTRVTPTPTATRPPRINPTPTPRPPTATPTPQVPTATDFPPQTPIPTPTY